MKDHYPRQTVHSSTGKVVVIPHPDYVGITEFVVEQGISERAIPIISSPRLCRGICEVHHRNYGDNDSCKGFSHNYYLLLIVSAAKLQIII